MRRQALLPWGALFVNCLVLLVALYFEFTGEGGISATGMVTVGFVLSYGAVGALIASRVSRHPVGWLLLAASGCFGLGALVVTYVEYAVSRSVPVSPLLVHTGNWAFGLGVALAGTVVLLYFPSGRLPSPRWRPWVGLSVVGTSMLLIGTALSSANFEGLPIDNPWALPPDHPGGLILEGGGLMILVLTMLAAVVSLVVRFRRGSAVERSQLKWVMLAMTVAVAGVLGSFLVEVLVIPVPNDLENFLVTVGFVLVAGSIALAILRYRLYEIDRIISRTVSYALVVVLLGLVVLVLVGVFAMFLPWDDPLVVAASTLAVAALFNPLRRRVRELVDRRFNRSRYDAERVVDGFAGTLRERVDPEGVADGWVGVVSETMQPASVGIWVRGR